jgi:hypothetical protein
MPANKRKQKQRAGSKDGKPSLNYRDRDAVQQALRARGYELSPEDYEGYDSLLAKAQKPSQVMVSVRKEGDTIFHQPALLRSILSGANSFVDPEEKQRRVRQV